MQQNTFLSSVIKSKVSVSEFRQLSISAGDDNAVIIWIKSPKTKLRTCRFTMTLSIDVLPEMVNYDIKP